MAAKNNKWKNPFYALLLPVGAGFCVTAFAYGFMAFQQVNATRSTVAQNAGHVLFTWLRSHGTAAIMLELAVLAVLTVGAIATDNWWTGDEAPSPSDAEALQTTDER